MKYKTIILIFSLSLNLLLSGNTNANPLDNVDESRKLFDKFNSLSWEQVQFDTFIQGWEKNWFLDGKKARINHSEKGMDFWAGPIRREDASHAVMWTKKEFSGDIRLDYEYTKLDNTTEAVTILYIQATGKGEKGYETDISKWAEKREVAAMNQYYRNMNLLHISYAAFKIGNRIDGNDYIRARRYMPQWSTGLKNTDLVPDYLETGLFKKGEKHKITIIKKGEDLFMYIRNNNNSKLCHWKTDKFPPVTEGRIGLRHMWTRGARYANFKISKLSE